MTLELLQQNLVESLREIRLNNQELEGYLNRLDYTTDKTHEPGSPDSESTGLVNDLGLIARDLHTEINKSRILNQRFSSLIYKSEGSYIQ